MIVWHFILKVLSDTVIRVSLLMELFGGWTIYGAEVYSYLHVSAFFLYCRLYTTSVVQFPFSLTCDIGFDVFLRIRLSGADLRVLVYQILTLLIFHRLQVTLDSIILGCSFFEFSSHFASHWAHCTLLSNSVITSMPWIRILLALVRLADYVCDLASCIWYSPLYVGGWT